MWEFRGPSKAEERYRKGVFASLHLPPGFSATIDERWYVTEEEQKQINFAIAVALVIIFMILAALYESFVLPFFILLAVPLSLIGVFVAFIVAKAPFDPTAYIGVILLSGIVVNNAILLVDHINLRRRQGLGLLEAVVRGTKDRIRPIFMTTATTIFGMLPMLLISAEANKRQIWSSLALCTIGGLTTFDAPHLHRHPRPLLSRRRPQGLGRGKGPRGAGAIQDPQSSRRDAARGRRHVSRSLELAPSETGPEAAPTSARATPPDHDNAYNRAL